MISCIILALIIWIIYKSINKNNIEGLDKERNNNYYIIYIILGIMMIISLYFVLKINKKSAFNKSLFEDYEKTTSEFYKWYDSA